MSEHTCHCEHQHHEHCGCSCGHKHHEDPKKDILMLGIGAVLFVAGILLQNLSWPVSVGIFVATYLMLGMEILKAAGRNLLRGQLFDENFLMSIATIAAFAIGEFPEAVGVMLFFRIGELFEHMAVEKSRNQIMDAVDLRPENVEIVHNHGTHIIAAAEAQIGDVLLVHVGDRIPLDGTVLEGESRIDTAPVTGEPVPVKVQKGDAVISGCINTQGVLKIRVDKVLADSMVSRILHSVEHAAASKPKMERFITRFARVYTPFVVVLAIATAVLPSLFSGEWSRWIYTAITFLVISCPCALVLSVPLAFFSGIGAGAKKGILLKGGMALEMLQQVKAVVMDKTGTVTEGVFEVQHCVSLCERSEGDILALAGICELHSTHPIATSIMKEISNRQMEIKEPISVKEFAGKGVYATTEDGEILCGNRALLSLYGVAVEEINEVSYGTEVVIALNKELLGYIVIADMVKKDAKKAVSEMKMQGIKTVMLTGDTKQNATAIAKLTGIEEVHARLLPEDKLQHLKEIRRQYGRVLFVGDGINDAPVLAGADVGAAMGSGADAAIEAADVVFMTSAVQAIPETLKIAKRTNRIAVQNIVLALGIKIVVMVLGILGVANMWLAVFADTGVAILCVLNAIRTLRIK